MSRKQVALTAAALVAAGVIGAGIFPSIAQVPPPPIAAEPLTGRAAFPDDVDMKLEIAPADDPERDRDGRRDGDADEIHVKVDDPTHTVVVRFTVQPGAQFPWHSHPGPVFVNVVEGTLVYVPADDCEHLPYPAGTAFVDPGHGHVHSAFNPGPGVTIIVATFFQAPPGTEPLLIPADAPPGCVL
jgi:quercetin dioxygenase-like cupin family protein